MSIPIRINNAEVKNVKPLGLIDSGAGGKFIDQNYAKAIGLKIETLETPLRAYNVDGTENKRGTIKNYVNVNTEINGRKIPIELLITRLGKEQIILGFPWLNEYNPDRRILLEERTKIFLQRQDLKTGRIGKKTIMTQTRRNHSEKRELT